MWDTVKCVNIHAFQVFWEKSERVEKKQYLKI